MASTRRNAFSAVGIRRTIRPFINRITARMCGNSGSHANQPREGDAPSTPSRGAPREENNLIDDPAHATALAQLKERLLAWYMATCDLVPHQAGNR